MDADAEGIYEEGDITLFGKLLMHRTKSGKLKPAMVEQITGWRELVEI